MCRENINVPDSPDVSLILSQTNGDIYDFEFSLVGKIWDVRETKKSRIVLDFSDIWKPGFKDSTHLIPAKKF